MSDTRLRWSHALLVGGIFVIAGCGKAPETPPPPAGQSAAPVMEAAPSAKPALSEKDKAKAEPYANDLGPAEVSADTLAGYPAPIRAGYALMIVRCAQCHTSARPLNSELIESEAWRRYVKRMMAKPGCSITGAEGKQIWEFLVHDSKVRKTGATAAAWKAHRADLLTKFKAQYPERWKLLYEGKSGS